MKEGFFKKIAIGVAVSLVSTAVIAGVSGLFSSGGSGGNNNVCTHETRTTDKEIAPTCILGGVSGMVRCLDCGEIVVEGEELPSTGHIGEVGETCTVCNEPIYGQYCSSERGTNERINREIRRLIPKGSDLSKYSVDDIQRVEDWVNNYPRQVLDFATSKELFEEQLSAVV